MRTKQYHWNETPFGFAILIIINPIRSYGNLQWPLQLMQYETTIARGIAKYLNRNVLPCYRIRLVCKVDGLDCHFYMRTLCNCRFVSPFRKCLTDHNEVSQKYTFFPCVNFFVAPIWHMDCRWIWYTDAVQFLFATWIFASYLTALSFS